MAKKSQIEKNEKRKRMVKRYAGKREKLKGIADDMSLAPEERFAARLRLSELPRNSAPGRVRNRCELTGRPRGYYRKVRLSRIMLRQMGNMGQIPGLVKSSW